MSMQNNGKNNKWEDRLKDYVQVNERIISFWKKYPNGRIHTEILSWENGILVMKASVWKDMNDPFPSAVGHAYEKENSSQINASSILENGETSAVGRCLAILGEMVSKSIASREEVANAIHQQEQAKKPSEPDRSNDPALKAKFTMLSGSLDGWEDFIEKTRSKNWTWAQIEEYMTDKIKERASQQSGGMFNENAGG